MAAEINAKKDQQSMGYDETLMYGQYRQDLGSYAKTLARKPKRETEVPKGFKKYTIGTCEKCTRGFSWFKDKIIWRIGEDWIFLTLLGIIMALLSFGMDFIIEKCQLARIWMYEELKFSVAAQFFCWLIFPIIFICFSTGFVHVVGPNAIGSGIPEMKTILRGVVLKEYLTLRTLISKIVGLCTSLGCGLPIGKEGPFVHVASIAATLLGKAGAAFQDIHDNETRNNEMLAAACAVGVACTFAAPIGGVLFSIEVTATYFAVRSYWRGFYAAVCGAFVFRILAVWFKDEETLTALFKTSLRTDFPFDPMEMLAYSVIGIVCGFAGALFVFLHRKFVEFIRKQKRLTSFLQKNRFIFPTFVSLLIMGLLFPPGLGQFMAGELTNHQAVNMLFSNFTWATRSYENIEQQRILDYWLGPMDNPFLSLSLFCIMRFWMSALATTLPVPAGVFIPVFTIGAAFGRLMGESMAVWFPDGIGGHQVVPGGYAIVGAAALSGSVTHTVSTAVIVFELTGQMSHVLPCVISVIIANAIAQCIELSIYDSLIVIKKLPYLPGIIPEHKINAHNVYVETFMVTDMNCLTLKSTYEDLQDLLQNHRFKHYPLVDAMDNMILLGSVARFHLEDLMALHGALDEDYRDTVVRFHPTVTIHELPPMPPTPAIEEDAADGATEEVPVLSPKKIGRFSVMAPSLSVSSPSLPKRLEAAAKNDAPALERAGSIQLEDMKSTEAQVQIEGDFMPRSSSLQDIVKFESWRIDPAPFQIVEKTSLYKVHSMFSLLGLQRAFVTNMGRLVGIVSLSDVRRAIQGHIDMTATTNRDSGPSSSNSNFSNNNTE